MKLFKLDGEYNVLPEKDTVMLIPEFKALWILKYNNQEGDRDGRDRKRGNGEIQYLYFSCDYRSEFSELSLSEREEAALNAAGLYPSYKISKELSAARDKYLFMQETRELKLLQSAYAVIDKLQEYFDEVDIDDSNAKTVIDNISKLGATLQGLKKLEDQVKKQEQKDGGIRGGGEQGFLI